MTKLKYIGCVFKEALRLYPPAPALTRVITDEMDVEGLKIPVGSSVNVSWPQIRCEYIRFLDAKLE